jgi:hypothetical protein
MKRARLAAVTGRYADTLTDLALYAVLGSIALHAASGVLTAAAAFKRPGKPAQAPAGPAEAER